MSLIYFVGEVRLSRELPAPVDNCPGIRPIFDPTNEATDMGDVSDLEIRVHCRIKVDVEAVQPRILLCEYARVEQRKCRSRSFVQVKGLIPREM